MKVLTVLTLLMLYVADDKADALNCFKSTSGKVESTAAACTKQETNCLMPEFVEYTGLTSAQEYACGDTCVNANCEKCATAGDECNKPVTFDTYICYVWKSVGSGTDAVWTKDTAETTCSKLTESKATCNAPNPSVKASDTAKYGYTVQKSGCGTCLVAEKTKGGCIECDGDKCNNNSPVLTVSFVLAALSALVYLM